MGWGNAANILNYPKSASTTRTLGAEVALIIENLVTNGGANYDLVWCVGHSLGAHLFAHAGMIKQIARITGINILKICEMGVLALLESVSLCISEVRCFTTFLW